MNMMTNLLPSEEIISEDTAIQIIEEYIYLGHEISRDKTAELFRKRTIGWAAFKKLHDIFKSKVSMK